jgi:hypothetical protein
MKTVIEMAREAGFMAITNDDPDVGAWYECFTSEIEAFAALVRADERSKCAKVCDELDAMNWSEAGEYSSGYGDEIRKRGTQ